MLLMGGASAGFKAVGAATGLAIGDGDGLGATWFNAVF